MSSGTPKNKPHIKRGHRAVGWLRFKLLSLFTKLKESGTVWFENLSHTGYNTETKKADTFDCGDLVTDKISQ